MVTLFSLNQTMTWVRLEPEMVGIISVHVKYCGVLDGPVEVAGHVLAPLVLVSVLLLLL